MITSKSPRKVAMVALAAGKEAFSDYSHVYSPHKFTQPQLFACLVLKEFGGKKTYRVRFLGKNTGSIRRYLFTPDGRTGRFRR